MEMKLSDKLARSIDRATKPLTALAGISLLAIVAVITVSVIARYLFNNPIKGSEELVQMAGIALVMLALPYATAQGAHVKVDIFDELLGNYGRMIGDTIGRIFSCFILAVICQRAFARIFDAYEYGDTTNMLQLPLWPFFAILMFGTGLCFLVYAVQLLLILMTRKEL